MFGASQHPSSGALKTVTATSGIGHNTGTATSFQCGLLRTGVSESCDYPGQDRARCPALVNAVMNFRVL